MVSRIRPLADNNVSIQTETGKQRQDVGRVDETEDAIGSRVTNCLSESLQTVSIIPPGGVERPRLLL
jgi:hypothetical protein